MVSKPLENIDKTSGEHVMQQMGTSKNAFARFASPFIKLARRVLRAIGIFTDSKAYRAEMARYETELQQPSR